LADKTKRIEEILEKTRIAFIKDTNNKMEQIQICFQQWKDHGNSQENLIDTTHRHVHSIKGLALTLTYPQIHNDCERILAFILQQESLIWTTSEINSLQSLVEHLRISVDESFAVHE